MPNALFEPIIGRDFDSIAQQRLAWAGFNANTEAQNLARAAAAEETMNRWALANAQMQREDAARQAMLNARAQENALTLGLTREQEAYKRAQDALAAKTQESQFARDLVFRREALAAQGEQAGEKLKLMEEQQKQRVDFNGERFAAQFGLLKQAAYTANEAADKAVSAFEKAKAEQMRISALPKKNDEDLAKLTEIGRTFADLERDARLKAKAAERVNSDFASLKARMESQGYEWSESSDRLSHPLGSREWSFAKAVEEAGGKGKDQPSPPSTTPSSAASGPGWFSRNVIKPVLSFGNAIGQGLIPESRPKITPIAPVSAAPSVSVEPSPLNPSQADVQDYLMKSRYAPNLLPGEPVTSTATIGADFTPQMPTEPEKPVSGRIYRDAAGNIVIERY